jgi:hypothetical protein
MPAWVLWEAELGKFVITGTGEEACKALKVTLDAERAAFQAGLDAMFKPAPPKAVPQPRKSATPAPPPPPRGSGNWKLGATHSARF